MLVVTPKAELRFCIPRRSTSSLEVAVGRALIKKPKTPLIRKGES